jgi:hypothetical protein
MDNMVISQFLCPLVGYRFRSLHHDSAHISVTWKLYKGGVGRFTVYQFIASAAATIVAISALRYSPA